MAGFVSGARVARCAADDESDRELTHPRSHPRGVLRSRVCRHRAVIGVGELRSVTCNPDPVMSDEKFDEPGTEQITEKVRAEIDEPRKDEALVAEPAEDDSWLYECSVTAD
jgi:hypothetical protein